VLPTIITEEHKNVKIIKGELKTPLLTEINATLGSVSYSELKEELSFSVSSFEGHLVKAVIKSLRKPSELYHNGEKIKSWISEYKSGIYVTEISVNQSQKVDTILVLLSELD
jgi:hypothetical protein